MNTDKPSIELNPEFVADVIDVAEEMRVDFCKRTVPKILAEGWDCNDIQGITDEVNRRYVRAVSREVRFRYIFHNSRRYLIFLLLGLFVLYVVKSGSWALAAAIVLGIALFWFSLSDD